MKKAQQIEQLLCEGKTRQQVGIELRTSQSYIRAVISRAKDRGPRELGEHRLYATARENSMKMNPVVPPHWEKALAMKRAGFSAWEIQNALPSGGF